ncbi:MAG: hypothetical protein QG661_1644 [Actinomycetota bacterium]|jgi:methionine synthase II (cobalamin-independent)|nr:hypothetical protein [Actinomycetota bacterium]
MIELMTGLPADVVGFVAKGEVTAADYRDILDPAVRAALARHERIRVLYVLGDEFTGYSGGALWDDAVVGTEHFGRFERMAVVSDKDWVRHSVNAFAWIMPTRIRVFDDSEQAEALVWVTGADSNH